MKTSHIRTLLLALALLGTTARGQNYANFNTGNFAYPTSALAHYFTPSFSGQVGFTGATGTISVTASTTGTHWGVGAGSVPAAPTGVPIDPSWIQPSFTQNYSVTGLTALAFAGASGQTTTISLDFSGMPNGYLPAGSVIAWADVDLNETATLTASGSGAWYSLDPANFAQAGMTLGSPYGSSQPAPSPSDYPIVTTNGAQLKFTGSGTPTTDSVVNFVVLQRDLTSLSVVSTGSPGFNFTQSLAISVVPEPSSALLALLGSAGFLLRRKRC